MSIVNNCLINNCTLYEWIGLVDSHPYEYVALGALVTTVALGSLYLYFNRTHSIAIKEPDRKIKSLAKIVFEGLPQDKLRIVFNKIIDNPKQFLKTRFWGNHVDLLNVFECACQESLTGGFNRTLTKRRQNFETEIVQDIKKNFNPSDMIHLCGFGSGGLLQELIILGKLVQQGYKNIHIDLIDPDYKRQGTERFRKNFISLFKRLGLDDVSICFSTSIEDLPEAKYDRVFAIDFDELSDNWGDLIECKKKLNPKGKLYLGAYNEDLIWESNGILRAMPNQLGTFKATFQDIEKEESFSQDSVTLAVLPIKRIEFMVLGLISALIAKGVKKIDLHLVHPDAKFSIREKVIAESIPKDIELCVKYSQSLNGDPDYFVGGIFHLPEGMDLKKASSHASYIVEQNSIRKIFPEGEYEIFSMKD